MPHQGAPHSLNTSVGTHGVSDACRPLQVKFTSAVKLSEGSAVEYSRDEEENFFKRLGKWRSGRRNPSKLHHPEEKDGRRPGGRPPTRPPALCVRVRAQSRRESPAIVHVSVTVAARCIQQGACQHLVRSSLMFCPTAPSSQNNQVRIFTAVSAERKNAERRFVKDERFV